jgi:hypothetical protein
MKFYVLLAASLIFLLGGSQAPESRSIDPAKLSGNISLTLKHGVWKPWQDKPVYQDITLDLVCDRGRCQPDVWAYAPSFNRDVDHEGILKLSQLNRVWHLTVEMKIQFHPDNPKLEKATYTIELIPYKQGWLGSYSGQFNHRSLGGEVTASMSPAWPVAIPNHQPIHPREHPRLAFRQQQLPALREKAKTPEGRAILAQLKKTLKTPIYYEAYVPNGGYHAAGYCLLSVLNQDAEATETAWQLVDNSIKRPGPRFLEQAPIVAGVALAYDLCYQNWSQERLKTVSRWLVAQSNRLIRGDSPQRGWNSSPWSNWYARAKGAAGLAALATLDEPQAFFSKPTDIRRLCKIAERNIQRYLTSAVGNRGFGTEGDHYTTEPWVLSILPFLQAYRNVMGQDLVTGSSAAWFLPQYLMRIIPARDGELPIPAYGRHRHYAGESLFALGLGTVPQPFLPGVMGFFNRYLGMQGDRTFGIRSPHDAAFVLGAYQTDVVPKNPADVFSRVLVDDQKGFYLFRNRWQDGDDMLASIYLKQEPLGGSWSFPDVGSFRIWGLGGHWANPGPSQGVSDNENVVVLPETRPWNSSQPTFFLSSANGSGIVSLRTDNIVRRNSHPPVGIGLLRSLAVDYSGASGAPGLFVVVDKFLASVDAPDLQNKTWVMHAEGKVTLDQQSFTIQSANGATMKGTFIAPSQVKLTFKKEGKGGKIQATGGNDFFVVMTVQKGNPPAVKVSGTGLDAIVRVGGQTLNFGRDRLFLEVF